jgi:hypothetical protein
MIAPGKDEPRMSGWTLFLAGICGLLLGAWLPTAVSEAACAWILWSHDRVIVEEIPTVRVFQAPIGVHPTHEACVSERRKTLETAAWFADQLRQGGNSGIEKVFANDSVVIRYYKPGTRQKLRSDTEGTVREQHEYVECWPSDFDPREKK